MHKAYYSSGSRSEVVGLDGDEIFIGDAEGVHSHQYSYELAGKQILGLVLNAQEVKLTATGSDEAINNFRRVTDADNKAKKPGTVIFDGQWHQRCYVVASESSAVYHGAVSIDITLVMLEGAWWRERSQHFVAGLSEDGLDFPFDFDFDLSFSTGKGSIEVESLSGASPKIIFYGPAVNPYIVVGGNLYGIEVNVSSGSQAIIDATTAKPSVVMRDVVGNEQNIFGKAIRDGGPGGGSYAFDPLPAGVLDVTWSGAFAFDLIWHEHDSEPPWNR